MSGSEELIWKLPCDVFGNIVTEYLSLQDISRLDVACCSYAERPVYFEALGSYGRLDEVTVTVSDELSWILKRGIKVRAVNIRSVEDAGILTSLVDSHHLFETLRLNISSCEPSRLDSALSLLCEIEQTVSCISVRQFAPDVSFIGSATFCGLGHFETELYHNTSEWVIGVISQNTRLQAINILAQDPPSQDLFSALYTRQSSLNNLRLITLPDASDALFTQVAATCPNLRSLIIGMPSAANRPLALITPMPPISQGVICVAQGCSELRELRILNCLLLDGVANELMLCGLRHLRVLDVLTTQMVLSDALLMALAECHSGGPCLTKLNVLWDVQLTTSISQAAAVLANLRRLGLRTLYPTPLADALQEGLVRLSRLQDLTLEVPEVPGSQLVSAVALGSPHLRSISVECGWEDVVDTGLVDVAQRCPLLERVYMKGGTISDELLRALAEHCPKFRVLSEEYARCAVTAAGIVSLIQGCPLLTTLDLQLEAIYELVVLQALAHRSYYLEKLHLPRGVRNNICEVHELVVSCKFLNTLWVRRAHFRDDVELRLLQLSRTRGRKLKFVYR
jgi:hypothetical protein